MSRDHSRADRSPRWSMRCPGRAAARYHGETFRMLADRTRLHLLWLLARGEADVTALASDRRRARRSASTWPSCGSPRLVETRKDGRRVFYRLRDGHLSRLVQEGLNHADHQVTGEPGIPDLQCERERQHAGRPYFRRPARGPGLRHRAVDDAHLGRRGAPGHSGRPAAVVPGRRARRRRHRPERPRWRIRAGVRYRHRAVHLVTQRVKANLFYRGLTFTSFRHRGHLTTAPKWSACGRTPPNPACPHRMAALRHRGSGRPLGAGLLPLAACCRCPGRRRYRAWRRPGAIGADQPVRRTPPRAGTSDFRLIRPGLVGAVLASTADVVSSAPELARHNHEHRCRTS